jgi:catechol 2,3-dioxygenase
MRTEPIHPGVRVGHIHLRVADLNRAIAFYRDVLGFRLTADGRGTGLDAALLAAGDYHHHITLNTWDSAGGSPPPPGRTGLYHVAFQYPDRRELGRAIKHLLDHGYPIDHGVTVSVYLADPDENGIELFHDRPRAEWFDAHGRTIIKAQPVDPNDLLPTPTTADRTGIGTMPRTVPVPRRAR